MTWVLFLSAMRKGELSNSVNILCVTNELHCPFMLVGTRQSLSPHHSSLSVSAPSSNEKQSLLQLHRKCARHLP